MSSSSSNEQKKKRSARSRSPPPKRTAPKSPKSRSRSRSPKSTVNSATNNPIYCHRCTKPDSKNQYGIGDWYGGYCQPCSTCVIKEETKSRNYWSHKPTAETLANRAVSLICWSCGLVKDKGIHVIQGPHPCRSNQTSVDLGGLSANTHWIATRYNSRCLVTAEMFKGSGNNIIIIISILSCSVRFLIC
jgi:hypothetical protein